MAPFCFFGGQTSRGTPIVVEKRDLPHLRTAGRGQAGSYDHLLFTKVNLEKGRLYHEDYSAQEAQAQAHSKATEAGGASCQEKPTCWSDVVLRGQGRLMRWRLLQ